jgi:hypothetical protein
MKAAWIWQRRHSSQWQYSVRHRRDPGILIPEKLKTEWGYPHAQTHTQKKKKQKDNTAETMGLLRVSSKNHHARRNDEAICYQQVTPDRRRAALATGEDCRSRCRSLAKTVENFI